MITNDIIAVHFFQKNLIRLLEKNDRYHWISLRFLSHLPTSRPQRLDFRLTGQAAIAAPTLQFNDQTDALFLKRPVLLEEFCSSIE